MKKPQHRSTCLDKLEKCSLFLTYRDAFEIATGYRLSLEMAQGNIEPGVLAIPVPTGRTSPLRLIASPTNLSICDGMDCQESMRGLLEAFAWQLGEESNRAMLESQQADSKAVVKAKEFIEENIGTKVHLDDVAAAAGICSFQLCRIFKHDTGITMTEYLNRKRVQKANKLLRDPYRQIAEISEQVGFTSLSQFGRSFLRFTGESPTEFRQRIKELEHYNLAEK